MARFGAEIRRRINLGSVSMREIYLHPNVADLARRLETLTSEASAAMPGQSSRDEFYRPLAFDYYRCGALQALTYLAWSFGTLWLFVNGIVWAYEALPNVAECYLRLALYSAALFLLYSAVPIVLKWTVIGRWRPEKIPVWSMRYFRFWLVKMATRTAPMALIGGPIRNVYLRLLGAKIGKNAVIQTRMIPVATDLVSIGEHTIIQKEAVVDGYKARSNYIHLGPIAIGSHACIGEAAVIDIHTIMEDHSQLAFASSLHQGQRIPKGKHFHGSPAVETTADYCAIEPRKCGALRRWVYAVASVLFGLAVSAIPMTVILAEGPELWNGIVEFEDAVLAHDVHALSLVTRTSILAMVWFLGFLVLRLLAIGILPRLLHVFLREDRTYVLYGFHYFVQRMISRISNSVFFNRLFGDSSAIVHYQRWVGYRLNKIVQTGSNFGIDQRHENPFLVDIGSGTMVSGGIKFVNETMSSDAFKLGAVKVGERNYLGNYLHVPSNSVVGVNCLVATKALVPIDGAVRENTGLLGAPAFEIPRATERDRRMAQIDEDTRRRQLRAKNRYNFVTAVLYLLSYWFLTLIFSAGVLSAVAVFPFWGIPGVFLAGALTLLCAVVWMWTAERGVLRCGQLQPKLVPLLDPYFWFHERVWKLTTLWFIAPLFAGTPIKNLLSRMEGVHLGKMVFDDGAYFDEHTMITIGDYATLASHSVIQPHSLEEGIFKSGRVRMGTGCTLGCAANLHYDVTMGDHVVIEPNSFVMKGETIEDGATWIGNPAQSAGSHRAVPIAEAA